VSYTRTGVGSDLIAHCKQTKRSYSAEDGSKLEQQAVDGSKQVKLFPYRGEGEGGGGMGTGRRPGRSALHGRRVSLRSGVAWPACLYQWSEAWSGCVRGWRRRSDECGGQLERELGEVASSP
jgi:hypothetical protein